MRRIRRKAYGAAAEVLVFEETAATPTLEPWASMRVKVAATALQSSDLVEGRLGAVPGSGVGREMSGVVVETRSESYAVGDEVFGVLDVDGSLADYCLASDANVAAKPAHLSHDKAAALPVLASAYAGLAPFAERIRGKRVVVLGGLSPAGGAALQVAKKLLDAAYAAADGGPDLLNVGCDQVCDDWARAQPPFDVVIDCSVDVGAWDRARAALPTSSIFLEWTDATFSSMGRRMGSLAGLHCEFACVDLSNNKPDAVTLGVVAKHAADGTLTPLIDSRYDFYLDNVLDMLAALKEAAPLRGSLICTVHTEAQAQER